MSNVNWFARKIKVKNIWNILFSKRFRINTYVMGNLVQKECAKMYLNKTNNDIKIDNDLILKLKRLEN